MEVRKKMWTTELLGTDLYHIVHWFLAYSFIGWVFESIFMSICNRKLTNRGFMTGPFCPIYGFGALSVYFILRPFSGNYFVLYVVGAVLATTFEYFVARLMQFIFGSVWWDYNDKPFNYKGILCLESTLGWGLYTILMFGFLHKFVQALVDSYSQRRGILLGNIVIILILLDMSAHMFREKKDVLNDSWYEIKEKWKDIRS